MRLFHMRIEYILGCITLLWAVAITAFPPQHFTNVYMWLMASLVVGSTQIYVAWNPQLLRTKVHFISAVMGATLWSFIAWNAKMAGASAELVLLYCLVSSISLWDLLRV